MALSRGLVLAVAVALTACQAGKTAEPGTGRDALARARDLVEGGRFDEAIVALGESSDPDALYLLGRAWAGKAASAPVPTPAPGSGQPAAALLKPEEERAVDFFGRAVALRPDHAAAHLATAELLAPHALALAGSGRAGAAAGGAGPSIERVLRAYADAVASDLGATEAVEGLIRFATAAGRAREADAAFEELARRRREDPGVLVRHGDFLAGAGGDPERALARYAQALIWRPDDTATRLRMAAIHLDAARSLLGLQQYAAAEARLREARKYAVVPSSPEAARLRELEAHLRDIRGR
jgi:tetratricopeptide (TPR) repeat protein